MRVATWNVNSVRARLPRLLAWLEHSRPDVVCLQETKVVDADFPATELAATGYDCVVYGQKTYNGVAILAREPITDAVRGLPDDAVDEDRRVIAGTVAGLRVISVYAPNGGTIDSDKYAYKLEWYRRLRGWLDASVDPAAPLLIAGDFNVAPEDRDVWDPELWRDQTLFSAPEKAALAALVGWGLVDTLRQHHAEGGLYTWWDYRQGAFHRGWGLRIDHILTSRSLASRCKAVTIDRDERKGEKPSDHAPVIASFA